jgi:hypothetical protein
MILQYARVGTFLAVYRYEYVLGGDPMRKKCVSGQSNRVAAISGQVNLSTFCHLAAMKVNIRRIIMAACLSGLLPPKLQAGVPGGQGVVTTTSSR